MHISSVVAIGFVGVLLQSAPAADELLLRTSSPQESTAAFEAQSHEEPAPDTATMRDAATEEEAPKSDFFSSLNDPPDYNPGRGLITLEGVTGMFLNPTSGTMPQGTFTAQYCIAILKQNDDEEYQHTAMFGYGVTDWLEVGGFFRISELDNSDHSLGAGGPYVRVRLLKDEEIIPELSVGFISRNGNDALYKQTLFVAASKRIPIDEDGFLRGVRVHLGFRQIWQDEDVNEKDGSIVYVGGEIDLPLDLHIVSEVSSRDDLFNHHPWSIGVQWRPNNRFGLSFAGVQSGNDDRLSLYIGVGVDF